jgi:hypothetical protein
LQGIKKLKEQTMKINKIKLTDEQKRIRSMRGKAIFAAGALTVGTIFGGCKDSPTDPAPTCDSFCIEKVHGEAPCNCGGTGCTCKQKYFKFLVDGVNITIENHTNEDIAGCATSIKDALLSYVGVYNTFDEALAYLKGKNNKANIILEYEQNNSYEPENVRMFNDGETFAIPFGWLITASDTEIEGAMIGGFDKMKEIGTSNARARFNTNLRIATIRLLPIKQFVAFKKTNENINKIISHSHVRQA